MRSFLTKNIILVIIVILAAVLRFYQLDQNPPSLNWDEISNGYNAYSILKTARDEYGNFLPLTFRAFGDYNPALSVYALVPSVAIFALNDFAVRFPSAFLGTLTVLLTYFLTLKLFTRRANTIAALAAFFLAISPWHLQFSRYDHEANFMVFFSILALTLLIYSFPKNLKLLLMSAVFFGLALNAYHGAKVWIPVFLIVTIFWYRREIYAFGSRLIYALLILGASSLPILLSVSNSLIRGQSVGIFHEKNPLEIFVSGYLSHFNPNFLFMAGDTIGRHSVQGMGQLYVFEIPLVIIGLIILIRQKSRHSKFLLSWLLVAAIPPALATPTPHALRALTFLPLWSIISALGIIAVAVNLKGKKKFLVVTVLSAVAFYNITTYFHLYYSHYPKEKAPDWQNGYKEMVEYVDSKKADYSKIAITNYYGHPYIYVLFYSKYDPATFQKQSGDQTKFDKFEFFGSSWSKNTTGKVLMVRPAWQTPNPAPKYLKFIYSKNGDLVFRISEE